MAACTVLWVAKYKMDWLLKAHKNKFFHLQAILGGVASMSIGGEEWMVRREQIYVIPPDTTHCIYDLSGGKVPLRMYDVKFVVNGNELSGDLSKLPRPLMTDNFTHFASQMEILLDESYKRLPYASEVIDARFMLIAAKMIRDYHKAETRQATAIFEEDKHYIVCGIDMPRLLKYIHSNITQALTLDHLAKYAGINKTSFTEVFKKYYGATPMRYINQLRISYAKEMLANSNASIGEVAASVGFSQHYFSRYFRSQLQCTPQEYRETHANNRFFVVSDEINKYP